MVSVQTAERLQEVLRKPGTTLADWDGSGAGNTVIEEVEIGGRAVRYYVNEFWTSRQRRALALHEVPYRACFKAELPRFFIQLLSEPGDLVYDPFAGRGTTAVEAALLHRRVTSNDINPLCEILVRPRLAPPRQSQVAERLEQVPLVHGLEAELDLSMFYHPDTESEIIALRNYLLQRLEEGALDSVDDWIRMVATTRLTGHSSGFFSVYTFPPNQAVTQKSQRRINRKRKQAPEYRPIAPRILAKSRDLLKALGRSQREALAESNGSAMFLTEDARETHAIAPESVQLTVTSPPFLDVVQYADDNWLRCWFNSIDLASVEARLTMARTVEAWSDVMGGVFQELYRVTRPDGWVAFEVGEVRNRKLLLEEVVVPLGLAAGFGCEGVVVNQQDFTKTSNIWGVRNNRAGTNTNRITLFHKAVERHRVH